MEWNLNKRIINFESYSKMKMMLNISLARWTPWSPAEGKQQTLCYTGTALVGCPSLCTSSIIATAKLSLVKRLSTDEIVKLRWTSRVLLMRVNENIYSKRLVTIF